MAVNHTPTLDDVRAALNHYAIGGTLSAVESSRLRNVIENTISSHDKLIEKTRRLLDVLRKCNWTTGESQDAEAVEVLVDAMQDVDEAVKQAEGK